MLLDLVTGNQINIPRVRTETGESVGKINGFSSKVSLSGCTMHTHIHTISQIHTPVIVSFALRQLKKKKEKKKERKKRSHSRLIALIFLT